MRPDGTVLPACNSLNGDKVLAVPEMIPESPQIVGKVRYALGGGLHQFEVLLG